MFCSRWLINQFGFFHQAVFIQMLQLLQCLYLLCHLIAFLHSVYVYFIFRKRLFIFDHYFSYRMINICQGHRHFRAVTIFVHMHVETYHYYGWFKHDLAIKLDSKYFRRVDFVNTRSLCSYVLSYCETADISFRSVHVIWVSSRSELYECLFRYVLGISWTNNLQRKRGDIFRKKLINLWSAALFQMAVSTGSPCNHLTIYMDIITYYMHRRFLFEGC